ncbi:uncharacterized protein L201_007973 [Kwoniella dendrophila CBS 6074]|uniref:Uncharacterized protein n=1 Tax=Kwoniella dendrophila CBS 6074 TaxID=1295534 RepID=A0AAX4K784_9TREE
MKRHHSADLSSSTNDVNDKEDILEKKQKLANDQNQNETDQATSAEVNPANPTSSTSTDSLDDPPKYIPWRDKNGNLPGTIISLYRKKKEQPKSPEENPQEGSEDDSSPSPDPVEKAILLGSRSVASLRFERIAQTPPKSNNKPYLSISEEYQNFLPPIRCYREPNWISGGSLVQSFNPAIVKHTFWQSAMPKFGQWKNRFYTKDMMQALITSLNATTENPKVYIHTTPGLPEKSILDKYVLIIGYEAGKEEGEWFPYMIGPKPKDWSEPSDEKVVWIWNVHQEPHPISKDKLESKYGKPLNWSLISLYTTSDRTKNVNANLWSSAFRKSRSYAINDSGPMASRIIRSILSMPELPYCTSEVIPAFDPTKISVDERWADLQTTRFYLFSSKRGQR